MPSRTPRLDIFLAGVVVLHLVICFVHGAAHSGAAVPLSVAANLFVFVVILAGPPAGLVVWRWIDARTGAWIVAATLAASLGFGLVNHFVIGGADHVAHVAASWRLMFGATAVLLAVTEACGSGAAIWSAMRMGRAS
jgi:uncharacterized membrane protein YhaH (DUF805 family)